MSFAGGRAPALLPQGQVADHGARLAQGDLRAELELARLAHVVEDRRAEQQVGVQARVQRARLLGERGDGHRVLEQAAQVGVVRGARARRAPQLGAEGGVREEGVEQAVVVRVVDLTREVLEEAVEFVEVAVGDGEELGRVCVLGPRHGAQLGHHLVAKALHAPARVHEVAALEPAREEVGVAEGAGRDRAGPIAELEREERRARPGRQAVLAGARVDAVELGAWAQLRDRRARGGVRGLES